MKLESYIKLFFLGLIVGLVVSMCGGCAAPRPQHERDDHYIRAAMNWEMCQYIHSGLYLRTSTDHDHRRGTHHRIYEIESDLRRNNCEMLLGDHWIDL